MRLIWDLEANGLLPTVTTIHSLLMKDMDNGQVYSCHEFHGWTNPNPNVITLSIEEGLNILAKADLRIGHNVIRYDLPALKKLYPQLELQGTDRDTMVTAKVIHPALKEEDSKRLASGVYDRETFKDANGRSLFGSHSLAAWGYRIGVPKAEYEGGFLQWSPEMQIYGEQDLEVTEALWKHLKVDEYSQQAIELEHRVAAILFQVEQDGIPFNFDEAINLQAELAAKKEEIRRSLVGLFPSWQAVAKRAIAKRDNKKLGRKKGEEYIVMKTVEFNPGSRDHIAKCLIEKYGWKPKEFTETGKPAINDEVLHSLPYPEARRLADYFVVCKVLGYVSDGDGNWMQYYDKDTGTIHGGYDPMGTVTSRCSHRQPNIAQTPSVATAPVFNDEGKKIGVKKLLGLEGGYGVECRALFINAPKGWKVVGSDMQGLELRCLSHYLAYYDKGRYADLVVNGDVHTQNMTAAGLVTREVAKTFIYAFLYGAGPGKIASIATCSTGKAKALINAFLKNTPGLKSLRSFVEGAASKGWLKALDGRRVPIRKAHAALNSLLQCCGAILCKNWMVLIVDDLERQGLVYGRDYRIAAFVHDELQFLVKDGFETIVGDTCKAMAVAVGHLFKFECALGADYKIGMNWSETH